MVRIIPIHNFQSQNVGKIEESTASCTANILGQDMLLLALSSHCVKVYSLMSSQSKLLTTFPTVDQVQQLIHCDKGNYVATLESKLSRNGTINNFVRIYINWVKTGNQNQPMRARIAGRVTPSLNRSQHSLEMIELPLNSQPTNIACCQTTGNILIGMGQEAVIHEFKVETQQTTKQKFLDFEMRPWSLKFTFEPTHIGFAENFIYVMNSMNFLLFRLTNRFYENINDIDNVEKIDKVKNDPHPGQNNYKKRLNENGKKNTQKSKETDIDFTRSINNERMYIDWDELVNNQVDEIQRLKSLKLIDSELNDFSISLPSVEKWNKEQNLHLTDLPFVEGQEINATIVTSDENGWSENYTVEHLLRLKISEKSQYNVQNIEGKFFTYVLMKPSYNRQESIKPNSKPALLRSNIYNVFNGVTCFISTIQEGYLYNFASPSSQKTSASFDCCQVYYFTAPVSHIALENTALHALTEAGLESYTLRIAQENDTLQINDYEDVEDVNDVDSMSLIGLRPFLGVKKMLQATKCLILLANDEETWTFYSLMLPRPEDIYHDILEVANNHKITSPSTYRCLLYEAYITLKLAKNIIYYTSSSSFSDETSITLILYLNSLYQQSCTLLADYYISSEFAINWHHSYFYYKEAGLKGHDVLIRDNINTAPGLTTFLSETLLNIQAGLDTDTLFQEHNIVDILVNAEKYDFLNLILSSPILREYATDKLINILSNWKFDDMTQLALVLLYTQADRQSQAEKVLETIEDNFLMKKILANWSWLFDVTSVQNGNTIPTFSDFAGTLMKQKIITFSEILRKIVEREAVNLDQVIQIFLAYLPSRVGRDGRIAATALQCFLETYLQYFYNSTSNTQLKNDNKNFAMIEGLKILVRSYLAELVCPNTGKMDYVNNENMMIKNILFENLRPSYLDHPLLYIKDEQIMASNDVKYTDVKNKKQKSIKNILRLELRKLQALLVSGYLPLECFQEVEHFLDTHKVEGSLSLRILCIKTTEEGIQLLVDVCPQLLLQFVKSKYTKELEWKCFVQFLVDKITEWKCDGEMYSIYDELLKETAVHIAQTISMEGLYRILPNNLSAYQRYTDISSQIVHADYIKTMIVGTGQHLLHHVNF